MITEEALPTYMAMLNTLDGVRDETGASPTPWGRWTRCAAVASCDLTSFSRRGSQ